MRSAALRGWPKRRFRDGSENRTIIYEYRIKGADSA